MARATLQKLSSKKLWHHFSLHGKNIAALTSIKALENIFSILQVSKMGKNTLSQKTPYCPLLYMGRIGLAHASHILHGREDIIFNIRKMSWSRQF